MLNDFDGARFAILAHSDAPFFEERLDVLVHRGRGREVEVLRDFAVARRIAMVPDVLADVGKDLCLFFGEGGHMVLWALKALVPSCL